MVTEGEPLAGRAPNIVEREGAEFVGWSDGTETYAPDELPAAAGNVTYTAVFEELQTIYKITWQDEEGNVLETSEVSPGERPNYPGEEQPIKEGFRFVGWSDGAETYAEDLPMVTKDVTYTAVYEQLYTITWLDEDGETVLGTTEAAAGEVPAFGDEPTKEATAQYTYTFAGWDPEPVEAAGEASYTATFEATLREYTITWLDEDEETVLGTTQVRAGEMPEYDAPVKEGYEFAGWDPELAEAAENAIYTAVYEAITYEITLNAVDFDQNPIEDRDVLVADVNPAAAGKTVTITAPGYSIVQITVTNDTDGSIVEVTEDGDGTTYTFEMPESAVTVEAMVEAIHYLIEWEMVPNEAEEEASIEVTVDGEVNETATVGQTVTVTINWPGESFALSSLTVSPVDENGEAGEPIDAEPSDDEPDVDGFTTRTYTFEMPASDVRITASFSQRYYINLDPAQRQLLNYADVTASVDGETVSSALPGDRVVLTIEPQTGVAVIAEDKPEVVGYDPDTGDSLTVAVDRDEGKYIFEMPEGSVEVSAELFPITITAENATITVSVEGTTLTAEDTAALLTDHDLTLTLNIVPDYGYFIQGYADISGIVPDNTDVTYADGNTDQNATYTFDISIASYTDMVFTITAG